MNERIKQLARQVESTIVTTRGNAYVSHPEFTEKFAELIIQDCIKYVRDAAFRAGGACTIVGEEGLWLAKDMEKHFGI